MTNFQSAMKQADSVTPVYLKTSELAFTKQPICLYTWAKVSSEYKGETNEQYKAHVVYKVDGKKQSGNIFLPANEWFDTLFFHLDGTAQHNLYVYKQGNAYRLAQYEKAECPCGHQQEPDHFTVDGEPVYTALPAPAGAAAPPSENGTLFDTLNIAPESITNKQMKTIALMSVALGADEYTDEQLERMSEREAETVILNLRRKHILG